MQGLSAGRVQSVAVRLVVERERERRRSSSAGYWDITASSIPARSRRGSPPSASAWRRAATSAGRAQVRRARAARRGRGARARRGARGLTFAVRSADEKPYTRGRGAVHDLDAAAGGEPQAPLQLADDDAGRPAPLRERLHHLHAHRLDDAVGGRADRRPPPGRRALRPDSIPDAPRQYTRKVKNAQEAHEAIRPAGDSFRTPKQLERELNRDELALYDLIWKRTLASQMADARGLTVSLRLGDDAERRDAEFAASGTVITFRGFLAAYEESRDDETEKEEERPLPHLKPGDELKALELEPEGRDHAARALHRGEPRPGARGARDRPPVDLRLDHRHDPRPRLRLQARHCARAVVPRLRRHRVARAALRPARRLLVHGADGGRPRPDRRRRARSGSTGFSTSTSAATTATRACTRSSPTSPRSTRARSTRSARRRQDRAASAATARTSSAGEERASVPEDMAPTS